jgi:hypothetical protein
LSPSPLGSTSSSSSPPRPREPTDRYDVVVAGSSVVVAPAIPLPSTQSRALTAPIARQSRRRRRRQRRSHNLFGPAESWFRSSAAAAAAIALLSPVANRKYLRFPELSRSAVLFIPIILTRANKTPSRANERRARGKARS